MRAISAFTLGVLTSAGLLLAASLAPVALGGDPCPPPAGGAPVAGAPTAVPPEAAAPALPQREKAFDQAFLLGLVGEWTCDCNFPTGDKAVGGASARLVMDGTALLTESVLQWKGADGKVDPLYAVGLWKMAADGKTVRFWGFSSHDSEADELSGTASDSMATVSGQTRWGPMRLTLSVTEGVLSQQIWINKHDMGVVKFAKAQK